MDIRTDVEVLERMRRRMAWATGMHGCHLKWAETPENKGKWRRILYRTLAVSLFLC
jgi:hypothetical protein